LCTNIALETTRISHRYFFHNFRLQSCVIKQTTVSMLSECGLSKILRCLEWYKVVSRIRLSTSTVRYLVRICLLDSLWV